MQAVKLPKHQQQEQRLIKIFLINCRYPPKDTRALYVHEKRKKLAPAVARRPLR